MGKPAVLYISYGGMLEPLGQSQVITYLERLTGEAKLHVISYEKAADWADEARRASIAERPQRAGITWHPLIYHKYPTVPATLYDITQGLFVVAEAGPSARSFVTDGALGVNSLRLRSSSAFRRSLLGQPRSVLDCSSGRHVSARGIVHMKRLIFGEWPRARLNSPALASKQLPPFRNKPIINFAVLRADVYCNVRGSVIASRQGFAADATPCERRRSYVHAGRNSYRGLHLSCDAS